MGLTVALNNALTGLNVNQQQLSVLSQNIANANTPGYSKQIAQQDSVYLSGQGQGVSISEIKRKVDDYLNAAVQKQGSVTATTGVVDDYSTRIQLLLGNPGNSNSVDSYINTFFNSVQSLAQTPQNTTLQQTAINNGVALADQVSGLATSLRDLQFQADKDINSAVQTVNVSLKRLASLNQIISANAAMGKSVADLEDQRDKTVADISQYINVSTFKQANGNLSATTGNGIPILDNSAYQLYYSPVSSAVAFSDGSALGAITIRRLDDNGAPTGEPITLSSANTPTNVTTVFTSGKIAGLMQMRDKEIPNISQQLDTLSSNIRDQMNAVHNAGSGYPGAASFTGTRPVYAQQVNQWSGSVRVAVLDSNGQPVASPYPDEPNGIAPLTLDLDKLNTQSGIGNPSVQGVIDAFNQYYGAPKNKTELGNLNNIQLVSDTTALPAVSSKFDFDFNLENLSSTKSNFYVTGVTVQNSSGVDITNVSSTAPSVALAATNTYVTTPGSNMVTVSTASSNNLSEGQVVYLSVPPGGPYDGISNQALGGYFTISHVTGNSFEVETTAYAATGGSFNVAGQTAIPPYANSLPGTDSRTATHGLITADLSGDTSSPFYTVSVTMGVDDGNGAVKTSVVTYRVNNQQPNALNKAVGADTASGSGTVVIPTSSRPIAVAMLVDANGNELPKRNGAYTNEVPGYLKIVAGTSTSTIAIDSLNSQELGDPTKSPPVPGSNRGFAHYFDLNDFFTSNKPTNTGDTVQGSALKLAVESRLKTNPGLLSLGQLTKSPNPVDPLANPNYTYQLNPGDNSVITKLATLASGNINFAAAGGLGATAQTFTGYTAQIIGSASTNAVTAKNNNTNATALMEGYSENQSAVSGVNLDTELANTVIYQNAYSASARVITVANQLFDVLLSTFSH